MKTGKFVYSPQKGGLTFRSGPLTFFLHIYIKKVRGPSPPPASLRGGMIICKKKSSRKLAGGGDICKKKVGEDSNIIIHT
jgi:hypothetical protein